MHPAVSADEHATRCRHRIIAGRYHVRGQLGSGAAATVHQVHDRSTGRQLALKLLRPGRAARTASVRLAFRKEFHTLSSMRHPNVLQVYDFGLCQAGGAFFTMELLDGDWLSQSRQLSAERACQLVLDLAAALAFLHGRRLVHGDVSRRNVGRASGGVAKLLDFGLLVTAGAPGAGKGTPPYMAPEVKTGRPLDHRTDLFSLGALSYSLLCGQHAFPARSGEELERLWLRRPAPPAVLVPSIPQKLSDLVVSMLSIDPLGRPSSAAEVIDRLRAFTPAAPRATAEVGREYLASAALVGRRREMRDLRRALTRAREGSSAAVVVSGCSGVGKSRLLRELEVEAQLSGAMTLQARCGAAHRQPYGVVHRLISHIVPAAASGAGALDALLQWVGLQRGLLNPARERAQLQSRLVERLLGLAVERPLVLVVDDLQRCDEASAAVLSALAHSAGRFRVLLVCALRTDEEVLAPAPLEALRRRASELVLRGLSRPAVKALVRAIFGDVDNVEAVARWMHRASGGSPLRCTELARHLVEQGRATFDVGAWRVSAEVEDLHLPSGLLEAMRARVETLGPGGRRLAEALAVHGGDLSLELCVELSAGGESAAFDALSELVQNEILIGAGERYRFRHDGLKEALLADLGAEGRRVLHLRVGRALQRARGGEEAVGWHLLHGGEELAGAELLRQAGLRHLQVQSFSDAVAPLEAALEAFERRGGHARRCCRLRMDLVRAGVIGDREATLRHGAAAITQLHGYAGLPLVQRLRPLMGAWLALALALVLTALRCVLTPRSRRGLMPLRALLDYLCMVNYLTAAKALSFDLEGVRAMPALLAPLPRGFVAVRTTMALCKNFELVLTGRWEETAVNAEYYLRRGRLIQRFVSRELDYLLGVGAMRYMLAFTAAYRAGPECLEHLRRLEATDLLFLEVSSRVGRLIYHRIRGEEAAARRVEATTRALMIQDGSMWLWESQLIVSSTVSHILAHNLPGLRQCIDDLERLVARGVQVQPYLTICRAACHLERGELPRARKLLVSVLVGPDCRDNPLVRQLAQVALAQVLLVQGDLERAAAMAAETLSGDPNGTGMIVLDTVASGVLAVAEARSGAPDPAARRLDAQIEAAPDNPLLLGDLHEKRALVALAARDLRGARRHVAQVDHRFRGTDNPALVARAEKLAALVAHPVTPRPVSYDEVDSLNLTRRCCSAA